MTSRVAVLATLGIVAIVGLLILLRRAAPVPRIVIGALLGGPLTYVTLGFALRGVDPDQPRFFSFPFSYMRPELNLPCWIAAYALGIALWTRYARDRNR